MFPTWEMISEDRQPQGLIEVQGGQASSYHATDER